MSSLWKYTLEWLFSFTLVHSGIYINIYGLPSYFFILKKIIIMYALHFLKIDTLRFNHDHPTPFYLRSPHQTIVASRIYCRAGIFEPGFYFLLLIMILIKFLFYYSWLLFWNIKCFSAIGFGDLFLNFPKADRMQVPFL